MATDRSRPISSPDPGGLLEYSVVYTERALNHMSARFQGVMREISAGLKAVYGADAVAIVPGGGSYGMEAVARQFATDARCLVIRNGWFSYRWTQIIEAGRITPECAVLTATPLADASKAPFAPPPLEAVLAHIRTHKPAVVFAPHVETSSGMILPDDYLRAVGEAVRSAGGLFVLDCIASGAMWVDMRTLGVDVLISAPQKGWSATPCAALVMLGTRALARMEVTSSTSFAADLKKWLAIMQAYENGGHAYHATLPTDGLVVLHDAMQETAAAGYAALREAQQRLGREVRALLAARGFPSVAAPGFEAPGVVVVYTDDPELQSGRKFVALGLQAAAGVPLQCGEGADFRTFRIGLFGLDKLRDIDGTVARLAGVLDRL